MKIKRRIAISAMALVPAQISDARLYIAGIRRPGAMT